MVIAASLCLCGPFHRPLNSCEHYCQCLSRLVLIVVLSPCASLSFSLFLAHFAHAFLPLFLCVCMSLCRCSVHVSLSARPFWPLPRLTTILLYIEAKPSPCLLPTDTNRTWRLSSGESHSMGASDAAQRCREVRSAAFRQKQPE